MPVMFRLALFVLALCATAGYGAVLLSVSLAPVVLRLDPGDAAAVTQATFRAGARRNELALHLVGPALISAVALSDGRLAWSAWWIWAALALWAATVALRATVVEPARRAALVVLGELAGAGAVEIDSKRALLRASLRRSQLGMLLMSVAFVAGAACAAFGAFA